LPAGRDPKTAFESHGLLDDLKKALTERMLNAEMDRHLGRESEQAGRQPSQQQQRQDGAHGHGKPELSIPRIGRRALNRR
jgi:putative transposase